MYRSHSDNRFLLICIEEFTLRFVGIQEWCSSFTFSSAFLLPENPSVVIAWHWTFEIILVMGGDKSWEKWTCFPPSAQQTSRLREHRMKWKDTGSSILAKSSKGHLRSKSWLHLHIIITTLDLQRRSAVFWSHERSAHALSKNITRSSRQQWNKSPLAVQVNNMTRSFNRTLFEVPKTF